METDTRKLDLATVKQWLTADTTLKLPGWAFLAGAALALVLVVVALD